MATVQPIIHNLQAESSWESLTCREKQYAYYLSRAAWNGARIAMEQTSPESNSIFNLILHLHEHCHGDWNALAGQQEIAEDDIASFLDYAGCFLSNQGNYYGNGDQKFIPSVSRYTVKRLSSVTSTSARLFANVEEAMYAIPPYNLGFPSGLAVAQSAYYLGDLHLSPAEEDMIVKVSATNNILPENTRIEKSLKGGKIYLTIKQASTKTYGNPRILYEDSSHAVQLINGDHSKHLGKICEELKNASEYTSSAVQMDYLNELIRSFESGDLHVYRESLKLWLKDSTPRVENVFGFVEPYRDPAGMKAEFEGIVGIVDTVANSHVEKLARQSSKVLKRLPWVQKRDVDNGPFEKSDFRAPIFVCMRTVAYCSSIIFPGINLPNYNDLREYYGHKSLIITNRMEIGFGTSNENPFIPDAEQCEFQQYAFETYRLYVILHELYGHPTGKLLVEGAGEASVDPNNPPLNPITGKPVSSWYVEGQTWTTVFGDLATTLDECRCELVAAFLMDDDELLKDLGIDNTEHILYNLFQQLGSDGLHGLADYHRQDQSWGSAHSQGHFAMLQWLLKEGDGVVRIEHNSTEHKLKVHVERSKIRTVGTPALSKMLLQLHIYRCTADVVSCRQFYQGLCSVTGTALIWHDIVKSTLPPKSRFVQPNIVENGQGLQIRSYPPTNEGIIQSWVDRRL